MPYIVCDEHQRVFQSYLGFMGHWRSLHGDAERPPETDVTVEEIPDGYNMAGAAPPRDETDTASEEPEERVPHPRPKKKQVAEAVADYPPEDMLGRTKFSLQVHQFPSGLATYIVNLLKMHPEAQDNAANFANFLNWVCSTSPEGKRHSVKVPMVTIEVFGQQSPETPYMPMMGQSPYGYSYFPGQAGWPGQPAWPQPMPQSQVLSPQDQGQLNALRSQVEDLSSKHNQLLDLLRQQAEEKRQSDVLQEIKAINARIDAMAQSKGNEEGGGYLKAYLDEKDKRESDYRAERDKRDEEREKRHAENLEAVSKRHEDAMVRFEGELKAARQDRDRAILEDKTRRGEVKAEMEAAGYRPGEHRTDKELDHDLLHEGLQIIPAQIDKGMDKIVDAVKSVAQNTPKPGETPPERKPRRIEDVAKQAELENQLLEKIGPG